MRPSPPSWLCRNSRPDLAVHHRSTKALTKPDIVPGKDPPLRPISQSAAAHPTRARRRHRALAALLLGAATVVIGAGPASGAEFGVTTTDDGGPGSLRDAIALASASGEPNVITLQDDATYVLDDCAAGALHHTGSQPLTIEGKGSTIRQTCAGHRVIETDSDLTVNDLTITGGDLPGGLGGGIEADTDSVTLVRSTVSGNHASTGGGVAAIHVTLVGSTVSDNTAGSTGGGVWADQTLAATNSTIAGNQAGAAGGGLVVVNTAIGLLHSTVVGNTAPVGSNIQIQPGGDELIAFASVIGTPQGGTSCDLAPGAVTTSQGANFSSDGSCGFGEAPDDLDGGGDPELGPLGANGGPTLTMLPATGSPLIDRAECVTGEAAVPTDQRAVARPQGARCDAGAVEVEQSSTPPSTSRPPARPPAARPAVPIAARPKFTG
jgi:hypothetical protein